MANDKTSRSKKTTVKKAVRAPKKDIELLTIDNEENIKKKKVKELKNRIEYEKRTVKEKKLEEEAKLEKEKYDNAIKSYNKFKQEKEDTKVTTSRYKRYRQNRVKNRMFKTKLIIGLISLVFIIAFIVFLFILNILPTKYIVIITIVFVLLDLLGIYLIDPRKKYKINIVGIVILILTTLVSGIGTYYLASTNNFLNKSFSKFRLEKTTYYVVALKERKFTKDDINGDIGVYSETVKLDRALEKLKKKYDVKEKEFEDVGLMLNSINNSEEEFLLVEKASYEIIFSISKEYKKSDYDIIYEFDIITKKKNTKKNTEKFNIYFGGSDFTGLRDFNMILSVNTKTHKILLTSIPRDYYIEVDGKNGRRDKLSFMSAYGMDTNRKSLEKLFDTNIDYSINVETSSLIDIVDYLGGIDFCSDYEFTTTHALTTTYDDSGRKLYVKKGCQHVNGIEALTISRERNAFPGRDRTRQKNCQQILITIFKELVSTDTMLHYNETLNTLGKLYTTDVPKSVISDFAKDIINNGNKWKIETQSVDGSDGHDLVHLSNIVDWVMYPDQKTIDKAKIKIKKTLK